jgi:hypothetical protein
VFFFGRLGAELQSMDTAGQFLSENSVDAPLPCHPVLAGEGGGHDLEPEMGLFAAHRAFVVMPGMEMRIIVDNQTKWLQSGFELLANAVGDAHINPTSRGALVAEIPHVLASLAPVSPACQASTQRPYL